MFIWSSAEIGNGTRIGDQARPAPGGSVEGRLGSHGFGGGAGELPDLSSPGSDHLRYFRFSQPEVALNEPVRSRNDVVAVYTLTGNTYNRLLKAYAR